MTPDPRRDDPARILLHAMYYLTQTADARKYKDWTAAVTLLDRKMAEILNQRNLGNLKYDL